MSQTLKKCSKKKLECQNRTEYGPSKVIKAFHLSNWTFKSKVMRKSKMSQNRQNLRILNTLKVIIKVQFIEKMSQTCPKLIVEAVFLFNIRSSHQFSLAVINS